MVRPIDARHVERKTVRDTVSVPWLDRQGDQKLYSTYSFDVSPERLSVHMAEPMLSACFVTLRSGMLRLVGRAVLNNCLRRKGSYRIGLERVSEMKGHAPTVMR